jgi:hypothetical protein
MLTFADYMGAVVGTGGAILLAWAGLPKLRSPPRWRRVIGSAETAAGVAVLLCPGRVAAMLLAVIFFGFTLAHIRGLGAGDSSCNCFVDQDEIVAARAAVLTGIVVLLAAGAAAVGTVSLRELAIQKPTALAWVPTVALIAAFAWRVAFSGTGLLTQVVDTSGAVLERGVTHGRHHGLDELIARRSFLLRVAVVGSGLVAAPLRYLLYPGTALGAVVGPWDCRSGNCVDGYTEFCCEINEGGVNACPTGTFAGGWWMCTDYAGRQLCSEQRVRYYVDCNALPGDPFPGGCRCGNDNCNNRRVACNVFRYGQCNTHVEGTTAVVCRMVVCENPATISELHCSAALAIDDAVCGHEARCLEPPAIELVGAGGA